MNELVPLGLSKDNDALFELDCPYDLESSINLLPYQIVSEHILFILPSPLQI